MNQDPRRDSPLAERIGTDAVRIQRLLDAPVETVWRYLIDPELRGRWFMPGRTDPRAGGEMILRVAHDEISPEPGEAPDWFRKYQGTESSHTILEIDPPRLLRFTFEGGSEVSWILEPAAEGRTLFTILNTGLPNRGAIIDVAGGWHSHSAILAEVVAGRTPANFWKVHDRVKGVYEQAFPEA